MVAKDAPARTASIDDRTGARLLEPILLFAAAGLGWWWSVRMARDMRTDNMAGMSGMEMSGGDAVNAAGFLLAWLAMMAAMMLPSMAPVLKLYRRAAAGGRVAPFPYFVAGYLVIWMVPAIPAYFAWRELAVSLASGSASAGRLAGAVFFVAGLWQLTPLKKTCLRHCRSPMSFFLRFGRSVDRPIGATKLGLIHGLYCGGCCWAMFAILVALGTMNIGWMLILTALIVAEKSFPVGEKVASIAGGLSLVFGVVLLLYPRFLATIT
jgi:predicted metal-binding membrane protein